MVSDPLHYVPDPTSDVRQDPDPTLLNIQANLRQNILLSHTINGKYKGDV